MALHVVRSLGQAFDVCHRLNPRPKKTKKEAETEEGEGEKKAKENGETEDKEEKMVNGTDISQEVSLTEEGKQKEAQQPQTTAQDDLIGLDFDPFSFNFEAQAGVGMLPNGAPQTPFESSFTTGQAAGGVPPTTFPPLMVTNNPSGLPDLPEGNAAAQKQLQLSGRPRPRPATTNQQVSTVYVIHLSEHVGSVIVVCELPTLISTLLCYAHSCQPLTPFTHLLHTYQGLISPTYHLNCVVYVRHFVPYHISVFTTKF